MAHNEARGLERVKGETRHGIREGIGNLNQTERIMPMQQMGFKPEYKNNPAKRGELADKKRLFGGCSRYAVAPVHTRFDSVQWFVWDAEALDESKRAQVIRQEATLQAALRGLTE